MKIIGFFFQYLCEYQKLKYNLRIKLMEQKFELQVQLEKVKFQLQMQLEKLKKGINGNDTTEPYY